MLVLSLLIGLVLGGGDRTRPYVREFSWQNKQVGAADTFFVLTFSRPMDHASVEANLHIEPPLPGKGSWAGRRLVYTLTNPAPYGATYKVELQKARQSMGKAGNPMQPFVGEFRTRDRVFAYLGVEGDEKGRLILYNLTHHQKTLLTPKNWVVTDFKPYPTGDRILFAASDWSNYGPGLFEQQLYTVTTGLSGMSATQPQSTQKAGSIKLILDNLDYQNMKFDLSSDGQVIVAFRVNRHHIEDSGLWVLRPDAPWQLLLKQPGGDFLITPDSAAIANTQGEGVAILSLTSQAKPLDFLPKFDKVLSFSSDGIRAAMVKLNSDYTQSLFLVTNQGVQKELLKTNGEWLNCQFDASAKNLYCLMTQLVQGNESSQQLSILGIELQTFKVKPLLVLPNQSEIEMSLSPDGLALLIDRVVKKETLPSQEDLTTDVGSAIATSRLFLLPLVNSTSASSNSPVPHQEIPVPGFHPHWLP
ncbi:Ig-like domain-containing protein [Allocoleopsis sp.]|uniref:Ig-like domain-containing protein n=1 Tax=Allocoleopsis sp. TaxID=3088169 RepID=UPI0032C237A4